MNLKIINKWNGSSAEAFMIGGMEPPAWFQDLLEEGTALISVNDDLHHKSRHAFRAPDGETMVLLLSFDEEIQKGRPGDWVVHYSDEYNHHATIFSKDMFRSTYAIKEEL